MQKTKHKMSIYLSWLVLVIFYLYQYILRSSPGVLIHEIRHDFLMNADEFAILGSLYYYGYSLMQVPLGVIIDRFGIRITALYSIALCIIGTALLVLSCDHNVAYISRLIVGIGAASAFMSSVKLAHDYLPESIQGVTIGATLTFGAAGALVTGGPLNYLLERFSSWQSAFLIFSAAGVFIWLLAFIFLPKANIKKQESICQETWHHFVKIIKTKEIMLYAFVAIGLFLPLSVMADLWGTAFLMKKFALTRDTAGPILMNIYIGMAVGSIILPYIAEKYNLINKVIQLSIFLLLLLFSLLVYVPNLNQASLTILLIAIGFLCGAEMLCFTAALKYVNSSVSGLTIGVVNTLNMLAGAIMQQVIGIYLDVTWKEALDENGLRIYSLNEFIEAFSILIVIMIICVVTALITLKNKQRIIV